MILGKNVCIEIGFIVCVYFVSKDLLKENLLKLYEDVFKGFGEFFGKYYINIDDIVILVIYLLRKVFVVFCDKVKMEF